MSKTPLNKRRRSRWAAILASLTLVAVGVVVCLVILNDGGSASAAEPNTSPAVTHVHVMSLTEAVPATCTKAGIKPYYRCTECGQYFADEAATEIIKDLSAWRVVPATGHINTWYGKIAATCTAAGRRAHYHCVVCGADFTADHRALPSAEVVIPALTHELAYHEAEPATCTENGTVGYYYCTHAECSALFADDSGTIALEEADLVDHALGHVYGNWVDAVPVTCTTPGQIAYCTCRNCEALFDEDYCLITADDLIVTKTHTYVLQSAQPATCTTPGWSNYFLCPDCGAKFSPSNTAPSGYREITDAEITIAVNENAHYYGTWTEVTPATATEHGIAEQTCIWCGDRQTALIHHFDEDGHCTCEACDVVTG